MAEKGKTKRKKRKRYTLRQLIDYAISQLHPGTPAPKLTKRDGAFYVVVEVSAEIDNQEPNR